MADLLDLLFIERQLSFRFSFLSVVCWSWHCCYILLLTAIIYTNTSHIAWEDQCETRKTHQAKKHFRYFPSPLLFCVFLCAAVFWFWFLSTECARAGSLSAEPIPDTDPINWVVIYVGNNTQRNDRSLNPSICDLSCISGYVQTVAFPSKARESLFLRWHSLKNNHKNTLRWHAKWKTTSC